MLPPGTRACAASVLLHGTQSTQVTPGALPAPARYLPDLSWRPTLWEVAAGHQDFLLMAKLQGTWPKSTERQILK